MKEARTSVLHDEIKWAMGDDVVRKRSIKIEHGGDGRAQGDARIRDDIGRDEANG
jgi:hypothetical protein